MTVFDTLLIFPQEIVNVTFTSISVGLACKEMKAKATNKAKMDNLAPRDLNILTPFLVKRNNIPVFLVVLIVQIMKKSKSFQ
jgi:hypothetical protein